MDFMEMYAQKKMTAEQAASLVKSGDWVDYGWCVNTPVAVDAALAKRLPELENVNFRGGILMWVPEIFQIDDPLDVPSERQTVVGVPAKHKVACGVKLCVAADQPGQPSQLLPQRPRIGCGDLYIRHSHTGRSHMGLGANVCQHLRRRGGEWDGRHILRRQPCHAVIARDGQPQIPRLFHAV